MLDNHRNVWKLTTIAPRLSNTFSLRMYSICSITEELPSVILFESVPEDQENHRRGFPRDHSGSKREHTSLGGKYMGTSCRDVRSIGASRRTHVATSIWLFQNNNTRTPFYSSIEMVASLSLISYLRTDSESSPDIPNKFFEELRASQGLVPKSFDAFSMGFPVSFWGGTARGEIRQTLSI